MVSVLKTLAHVSMQRIESVPSEQHIIFYSESLKYFKVGPIHLQALTSKHALTNTPLDYSEPAS